MTTMNIQLLTKAIKVGKSKIVRHLLCCGFEVDAKDSDYYTPLHNAAWHGQLEIVEMLIDKGATIDAETELKQTPLIFATFRGHYEIVKVLLSKGANANHLDVKQRAPIHFAFEYENVVTDIVTHLVKYGANVSLKNCYLQTPLILAARVGNSYVVNLLLKSASTDVNAFDSWQATALLYGTKFGHYEVVKILLKFDVDLDAKDYEGGTALHNAACFGYDKIVPLLVRRGACIDAQMFRSDKKTAIYLACERGHKKTVQTLLVCGASRYVRTGSAENILEFALLKDIDMTKIIIYGS